MKKYKLLLMPLILMHQLVSGEGKNHQITLTDELRPLYDLSLLPTYRTGTVETGISTYDRTGGNDDGFAGTYSFLRRNPDSSLVMLDVKGPGVINRFATPTPTSDTLDFYIDGAANPVLSVCYMDLFSGKVYPFTAPLCGNAVGGYYCYFPILFNKSCRIVCRGKQLQFHQFQYRLYPPGTKVRSFSLVLSPGEKGALARIAALWQNAQPAPADFSKDALQQTVYSGQVSPGQVKTVFSRNKGGRISGLVLDTTGIQNLWLRATWDGQKKYAVNCPLKAFLGYYHGKTAMHSLLCGVRNDKAYVWFPMPFDKGAKLEIINRSSNIQQVKILVWYSDRERDTKKEGRFYACFKEQKLTEKDPLCVLLQIKGKGHYVGMILKAQGLNPRFGTRFFEGDDSTATDGIFRLHGTGSEDYFNGGWYNLPGKWDHPQSLPLHGCLGYSDQNLRTGGYRLMIGDKIPFEHSIFQSIEHGPSEKEAIPAIYTSVAFYYADR